MTSLAGHGTHARYIAGCRCAECRDANRRYKTDWRARNADKVQTSALARDRRLRAAWAWIRANRPDVAATIREEAAR